MSFYIFCKADGAVNRTDCSSTAVFMSFNTGYIVCDHPNGYIIYAGHPAQSCLQDTRYVVFTIEDETPILINTDTLKDEWLDDEYAYTIVDTETDMVIHRREEDNYPITICK